MPVAGDLEGRYPSRPSRFASAMPKRRSTRSERWSPTNSSCCDPRSTAGWRRSISPKAASVSKGDILVELDSSVERAELAQAQAQLILARSNFERAKELRRNNVGTQRALDEADAALRTADAMIDLAQARLSKRKLVAPFDAWAGLRTVSPGDFVTTDTKIVNLEQTDPLKVDFRVPETLPAGRGAGTEDRARDRRLSRHRLHRHGSCPRSVGRCRRTRRGRARRDRERRRQASAQDCSLACA